MKIKTVTAFDPIAREDRKFFVVPMAAERADGIVENATSRKATSTRVMTGRVVRSGIHESPDNQRTQYLIVELLCASRDTAEYYARPMPVMFRMADTACGGDCVAIFPTEPFSLAGNTYEARTWRGRTQVRFADADRLRPATPDEYAALLTDIRCFEPERNVRIVKRISAAMRDAYACKVREDRAIVRRESDCQLPDDRDMSAADWNRL